MKAAQDMGWEFNCMIPPNFGSCVVVGVSLGQQLLCSEANAVQIKYYSECHKHPAYISIENHVSL
jgi:hypothetical protein